MQKFALIQFIQSNFTHTKKTHSLKKADKAYSLHLKIYIYIFKFIYVHMHTYGGGERLLIATATNYK